MTEEERETRLTRAGKRAGEDVIDFVERLHDARRFAQDRCADVVKALGGRIELNETPAGAVLRLVGALVAAEADAKEAREEALRAGADGEVSRDVAERLREKLQNSERLVQDLDGALVAARDFERKAREEAVRANASERRLTRTLEKVIAESDRLGRREDEDVLTFLRRLGDGGDDGLSEFLSETAKLGRIGGESPLHFARRLDEEIRRLQNVGAKLRADKAKLQEDLAKSEENVRKAQNDLMRRALYGVYVRAAESEEAGVKIVRDGVEIDGAVAIHVYVV